LDKQTSKTKKNGPKKKRDKNQPKLATPVDGSEKRDDKNAKRQQKATYGNGVREGRRIGSV